MPSTPDTTAEHAPLLLKAPQAARRLGVSWITFRRLLDSGEIPYVQAGPGATRWVEESELRRWIDRHRVDVRKTPAPSAV